MLIISNLQSFGIYFANKNALSFLLAAGIYLVADYTTEGE